MSVLGAGRLDCACLLHVAVDGWSRVKLKEVQSMSRVQVGKDGCQWAMTGHSRQSIHPTLHSYPLHHHHLPVLCTSLVTPYAYMLARVHDDDAKWRLPAEEGKVSNGILSLLSIIVIIIHCRVHSMP